MSAAPQLVEGRYRLAEVLGTGGAAVVRRAHDERLGRDVAIKMFHPGTADEQRQCCEMALMASVAHLSLVRMYDGGWTLDANGARSIYLVMEYVAGPTLRQALDRGPMSAVGLAPIATALASGLAYLHERDVVHRDVKPANVLLPTNGEVAAKLGDFGIARMLDGSRVTATGMTVGTANYLSPEQARGQAVGPASDIYSLGLVLLEALTGRVEYDGVGVAAAVARLARAPQIPDAVGPGWSELLAGMLEGDPALRPTAAQVCCQVAAVGTGAGGLASGHPVHAATIAPQVDPTALLPTRSTGGGPRHRRARRPRLAFVLAGVSTAGIVLSLLSALIGSGTSTSPAAPADPGVSSAALPARAGSAQASRHSTASHPADRTTAAVRATQVAKALTPANDAAPSPANHAAPHPVTRPGKGPNKAKGHAKHGKR